MQAHYSLAPVQSLKMNVTPQFMQAMNILQSSSDELIEFIHQQSVENPLLNIEWPYMQVPGKRSRKASFSANSVQDYLLNNISRPGDTLEMLLLSQLRLNGISKKLYPITQYMAGNVDEEGYLVVTLEEASYACKASMEDVQAALECLQSLEPAGVGARSLKECLQLQISRDPLADPWAYRIVSDYLNELGSSKYKLIAEKLQISLEDLKESVRYIRSLNPRPVSSRENQPPKYIQPDALIKKEQGEYRVIMNENHLPKLSLNKSYHQFLFKKEDSEASHYLRNYLQSAKWLLSSLEQRASTLYRVISSIVEEQRSFFDGGISYLKPMNLRDIATKLEIHESTVSRATQDKYVQTPHGLFELKFFFTSGLSTSDGKETSAESIKARIKHLIDNEDKRKPLSDQMITDLLVREGIQISRRTVMKYREELRLLSSRLRFSG